MFVNCIISDEGIKVPKGSLRMTMPKRRKEGLIVMMTMRDLTKGLRSQSPDNKIKRVKVM